MMPLMPVTDASSDKTAMLVMSDFPAEQPDHATLKEWFDQNLNALMSAGLGSTMRGEVPPELLQYTIKKEIKKIPEEASDSVKAAITEKNEENAMYNRALKLQL